MSSIAVSEWRAKCQELFSENNRINWIDEGSGYLACPFSHLHTKKTGPRDTILYLDTGVPIVSCLHARCKQDLRDINRFLRIQLGVPKGPLNLEKRQSHKIEECLRKNRETLIEKYLPRVRELTNPPMSSSAFLVWMFGRQAWVWIGQPYCTGAEFKRCFRTVQDWADDPPVSQLQFVCPNPLKSGCYDRKQENVQELKYLVLESDELNIMESRGMFEAVEDVFFLKLQAIVFSGGKSLHGWFKHPGHEWIQKNKGLLEAMGFDPAAMRPTQPVRLAGARRDNGKTQSLVWIGGDRVDE